MSVSIAVIAAAMALVVYSYLLYPALLWLWGMAKRAPEPALPDAGTWPLISITIPVYNERPQIRELIESLLRIDYPADRRQIVFVSDASTDGTDEIIAEYASQGVELVRQDQRRGKTAAENAARAILRGELVINTDASIRIAPDAVKPLVRQFADPSIGVASGRDISVTRAGSVQNEAEAGYVGYEMTVRALETRVYGIVGASGCFYAIRPHLHRNFLPEGLSRDFASALVARQHGFRAVSVNEAVCYVPRTPSLRAEYRRKVRTITRGMQTLFFQRRLLNPLRYGVFSWMLFSHKVCRWLTPWAGVALLVALAALAASSPVALVLLALSALGGALALAGWLWPPSRQVPKLFSVPAFLAAGNVAVLHASVNAWRGQLHPVWEPTRRDVTTDARIAAAS